MHFVRLSSILHLIAKENISQYFDIMQIYRCVPMWAAFMVML